MAFLPPSLTFKGTLKEEGSGTDDGGQHMSRLKIQKCQRDSHRNEWTYSLKKAGEGLKLSTCVGENGK